MMKKLATYAQLMRLSNAPTVVTNVLVGYAIAHRACWTSPEYTTLALVLLIYFAGMMLNDVFDAKYDSVHKPDRPIPAGRVSRTEVLLVSVVALAAGITLGFLTSATVGFFALALCGCVLAYDALHKLSPAFVVVMGACRALVYTIGFAEFSTDDDNSRLWAVITSILVYIALLTFVARREDDGTVGWRAKLCVLMPLTIVAPAWVLAREQGFSGLAYVTLSLFVIWMTRSCWLLLRKSPDVRGAVMGWLSGICLFDAALLALNQNDTLSFVALGCFALTALAHRFVPGT